MIGIKAAVEFGLLFFCQREGIWNFRDAIPNGFDQKNPFGNAQLEDISFCHDAHNAVNILRFVAYLNP